ncbi:MAG: glutathione S-transferase family protein [Gammaproteobacteria bacterium]|nr:glutathione S-transferase family protein [Gammaproteobacteria bacterium]
MSKRVLLFTTGSPFSRIVRIVLDELCLDYERREEITAPASESRAESTPTLQVPTFWDGDQHLWESGLIVEYLLANYTSPREGNPPLAGSLTRKKSQWQDRLVASSIHTLGTTATIIGQMKWGGTSIENSDYLTVCSEQFPYLLSWLENQIPSLGEGFQPGALSLQDIALGCHLGYILNRPIGIDPKLENFPRVRSLIDSLNERESFNNSPILWWEPGVIGYAGDGVTPVYKND